MNSEVAAVLEGTQRWCVVAGDNMATLRAMPDSCVDSVVTDPPYGLANFSPETVADVLKAWLTTDRGAVPTGAGFMGRSWDAFVPPPALWDEVYRVLKPGGHVVAFAAPRTYDLMCMSIRLARFEVRDQIDYVFATGFPKSLNLSKGFDKRRHDREMVLEVTAWIREARDRAAVTNQEIDDAFGFVGMSGHWTTAASPPAVPTLEQVPTLLKVLRVAEADLPPRVAELLVNLNRRKGQPGESWETAEVVGDHGPVPTPVVSSLLSGVSDSSIRAPNSDLAKKWAGFGTAMKPAFEPCVLGRKPHTVRSCLSTLSARIAAASSQSSLTGFVEAFASALRSVGPQFATPGASSEAMATSQSESDLNLSLSTVSSWLDIWDAVSTHTSTSTTKTKLDTIIDSRILSSCLSKITHASTGGLETELRSHVRTVASLFSVSARWLETIQTLAAIESATSQLPTDSVDLTAESHAQIVLARKPPDGTLLDNVAKHGTGALNISACRIPMSEEDAEAINEMGGFGKATAERTGIIYNLANRKTPLPNIDSAAHPKGRWPPNMIFAHSEDCNSHCAPDCAVAELDRQSGEAQSNKAPAGGWVGEKSSSFSFGDKTAMLREESTYNDFGGASRFFFTAKPKRTERDRGCDDLPLRTAADVTGRKEGSAGIENPRAGTAPAAGARNHHVTVKPVDLMAYLCRLVTPPGGVVLEPFAGSGTTGVAAQQEGLRCVALELSDEYAEIARARIRDSEARIYTPEKVADATALPGQLKLFGG